MTVERIDPEFLSCSRFSWYAPISKDLRFMRSELESAKAYARFLTEVVDVYGAEIEDLDG